MPLLFLDENCGICYYFHTRNSNVSLREILTSIAFLLLAVCAVLGVAGMFLPWTEADVAGSGIVQVTLYDYGRVSSDTGGVIPAMTAQGAVASVLMGFSVVFLAVSLIKGKQRYLLISAISGVVALTLAICAIVYTGTTTWRWSQRWEACFLGELGKGGAYLGTGCYLTCSSVCTGGILSAVYYFIGLRGKAGREQ